MLLSIETIENSAVNRRCFGAINTGLAVWTSFVAIIRNSDYIFQYMLSQFGIGYASLYK